MWPRRSQPPAAARATSPRAPARTAAPEKTTTLAADDDCGWLMRAVESKKKKPAKPSDKSCGVNPTAKTTAKKRPLEVKTSGGGAKSKLPRGIGWSQPSKPAAKAIAAGLDAEPSATAPPGESFDDVFAEIYGSSKRAPSAVAALDGDTPSLPLSASLFLPETPVETNGKALSVVRAPPRVATGKAESKQDKKWDFESPSAIKLDAFDESMSGASGKRDDGGLGNARFSEWKDERSSHTVSDNFVRLNMRKRFKGSTGKAKKLPAYLRNRGFVDADEKAQNQKKADSTADVARPGSGGLLDDGVEFIEECLEMLKRHERSGDSSGGHGGEAVQAVPGSAVEPAQIDPPRCQHALVCQRVLVKKKNKNHGRAFFSCPLGYDEGRCDYFLWEENHTQFALYRLFDGSTSTEAAPDDVSDDASTKYIPLDLNKSMETQHKAMLTNLRLVFGHSDFRPGQEWAIERIFQKKRTLLVLPTGAGKSLCYQYPALFLPGITIVISPLISLMNDQFHNLPPVLKKQATCVTTSSSSKTQYAEFVRDLLGGKLKLLFVSPEKALTSGFQRLLSQMQSRISLVCVDEAHCISEWSHHFRPSYLRLQAIFGLADSVLAITATASRRVECDVLSQLTRSPEQEEIDVGDEESKRVLRMPWQRDNLRLRVARVSSDEERLEKLCDVLTKSNINGAIIMYVHQQWQAEAMANLLQERLTADGSPGGKSKWTKHKIAAYHAKMDADAKEKVRLGFLSGRVKLVIATIAFGMGIDKQNVRLVVHYHVPSSIEHYLQQVGRAGRDGRPASALLFLLDDDVRAFRSLLFSNALHVSQLQRLVELVTGTNTDEASRAFAQQNAMTLQQPTERVARCSRVWMHVASLEQHLDMKSAMVETFITLMSLHREVQSEMQLSIHPTAMSWCVISLMETQLKNPHADPVLKRLVGSVANNGASSARGHVEIEVEGYLRHLTVHFHVASLASELMPVEQRSNLFGEMDNRIVDIQARRLMQSVRTWQANGLVKKFQMERSAFDLSIAWTGGPANEAGEQERRRELAHKWTRQLYARHEELEAMEIKRLRHLHSALSLAAASKPASSILLDEDFDAEEDADDNHVLEDKLSEYFDEVHESEAATQDAATEDLALWRSLTTPLTPDLVEAIERDVEALTSRPPNASIDGGEDRHEAPRATIAPRELSMEWHGYSVARIFHGLASPCFPSKMWRDQLWWRKYNHVAFEKLVVIADRVILAQRSARGDGLC